MIASIFDFLQLDLGVTEGEVRAEPEFAVRERDTCGCGVTGAITVAVQVPDETGMVLTARRVCGSCYEATVWGQS